MALPVHQLQKRNKWVLTESETISLIYHDIFGYPLKKHELLRWAPGSKLRLRKARPRVSLVDNYYCLSGREEIINKRIEKEQVSLEKMKIVSTYKSNFEDDKNILMVGITGSLAMSSASPGSDIDLLIVTKNNLWITRLKSLIYFKKKRAVRSPNNKNQKNMLCLNMWMDLSDMIIEERNRNAYTAHEIGQIVPLINRENTYEKLLFENSWILNYWPNSVELKNAKACHKSKKGNIFEWGAYRLQKAYMRRKMTREVVTPTRAFFHPTDWSGKVIKELERRGVSHV